MDEHQTFIILAVACTISAIIGFGVGCYVVYDKINFLKKKTRAVSVFKSKK